VEKQDVAMPDSLQMVLRNDGFKEKGGTWTRENLCSGGVFDLTMRVATEEDVAASESVRPAKTPWYALQITPKGGPASPVYLRDEDGAMRLVAIFLAA
jgi:hypothetical protein